MLEGTQGVRLRLVAAAVSAALGLTGCGGGSNVKSSPPPASGAGGGTTASNIVVAAGTTLAVSGSQSVTNPVVLEHDATLDNAGKVGGAIAIAVEGKSAPDGDNATVLNHDGGSITGTDHAVLLNAFGMVKNSRGAVIDGGVVGVGLEAGGVLVNDGAGSIIRSSGGTAVQILGDSGTVTNTGGATIQGGSKAIYLAYGGSITNGAGSTIQATGTAGGDCGQGGSCAIYVASNANSKHNPTGLMTLVNAGTIIGNVQLVPQGTSDVTLVAGGTIRGNLDIGSASLTLDGAAGTRQLYSQAVTGTTTFGGELSKTGDGTWVIDRDGVTGNYGVSINGGTLQIGNGGTVGSIGLGGAFIHQGELVFDRSDDVVFANNISSGGAGSTDNGTLVQAGTGVLTLLTSSQIDPTHIAIRNGTLQIRDGTLPPAIGGGSGYFLFADTSNDGVLKFDSSAPIFYESAISGTGTVVKDGAGNLIFDAENTYTGGTTINQGTLQLGLGASTGSITGDVVDNSALVFDRQDEVTFSGRISGTGTLEQQGTGKLILTGNSTYTGGTTISQGTLQIGNGATEGAITGDVVNDGVLVYDRSDDVTVAGLVSGTGQFVKSGTGTLIVSGANTYSGGTTVDQGTLEVAPGAGLGAGTITTGGAYSSYLGQVLKVDSGASLSNYIVLNQTSTLDNAGSISSSATTAPVESGATGSVSILNHDGGVIDGSRDVGILLHDGGTIFNGSGSLIRGLDHGVVSQGAPITINNVGASIVSTQGDALFLFGETITISNTQGGIIHGEGGGITSWSNATTITNSGGSSIIGDTNNDYGIELLRGGVVINDGSTISSPYRALYTYSGPTTFSNINGGSVVGSVLLDTNSSNAVTLMAGSSIQGDLSMGTNSTLTLTGDNATPQLYSDAVTGTSSSVGTLKKEGTGTWDLDAGYPTGFIQAIVDNGTLRAASVLSGMFVGVEAQGTLDAVPGTMNDLYNAGKVAVHGGDSTVGGNYTQDATGTLAVSLGSKLAVSGTATLNGGTLEITGADSGYVSATHTDVLTATGGVTGTFDQLVKDSGVVFTSTTIQYDANSVWLDTTGLNVTTAAAGGGVSYTPASFGSAQRVQGAFTQLNKKISADNLSAVSTTFLKAAGEFQQAPSLQAAQASLQSLSGELYAASAAMTFESIDASSRALSERFDRMLGNGAGYGVWTGNLNLAGDMARTGYEGAGFQMDGWLLGSDRQVGRSGMAGFAFGQSQGLQRMGLGFDHDINRSTEGMLYAGWLDGNWYTHGRIGLGQFQQSVDRRILLGYSSQGVSTHYTGRYNVAYGESGLKLQLGGSRITPFVNLDYASIYRGGFTEQGGSGFGLRSNPQRLERWQAGLGVRVGHHWNFDCGRSMDFSAHAQWQRALRTHGDVFDASFVGMEQWQPVTGIGLSRYVGRLGFDMDTTLSKRAALKFGYDYQLGQRDRAQMLSARLNVAF